MTYLVAAWAGGLVAFTYYIFADFRDLFRGKEHDE